MSESKKHPLIGKRIIYRDGSISFEADVIAVKAGPMVATMDFNAPSLPIRSTIKLRVKPLDGRPAFWTAPMEYRGPTHDHD